MSFDINLKEKTRKTELTIWGARDYLATMLSLRVFRRMHEWFEVFLLGRIKRRCMPVLRVVTIEGGGADGRIKGVFVVPKEYLAS